jgi:hypothetical protein
LQQDLSFLSFEQVHRAANFAQQPRGFTISQTVVEREVQELKVEGGELVLPPCIAQELALLYFQAGFTSLNGFIEAIVDGLEHRHVSVHDHALSSDPKVERAIVVDFVPEYRRGAVAVPRIANATRQRSSHRDLVGRVEVPLADPFVVDVVLVEREP